MRPFLMQAPPDWLLEARKSGALRLRKEGGLTRTARVPIRCHRLLAERCSDWRDLCCWYFRKLGRSCCLTAAGASPVLHWRPGRTLRTDLQTAL